MQGQSLLNLGDILRERKKCTYLSSEAVPRDADIDCVKSFPAGGGRTVNLSCEEDRASASSPYSALSRPLLGEANEFEQRFVQARLVDQKGNGGRFSSWDDQPSTLCEVLRTADLDDGEPGLLRQRVQGMDVFGEGALECAGGDSGQVPVSRSRWVLTKTASERSQDSDCVPGWRVPHAARSRRRLRVHVPVYAVSGAFGVDSVSSDGDVRKLRSAISRSAASLIPLSFRTPCS
jgi:hypothetical protein